MTLDTRVASAISAIAELCTDRSAEVGARPAMSGEPVVGLFSYFDDVVNGRLDAEDTRREAAAWAELVTTRWSAGHPATARVQQALDHLVEVGDRAPLPAVVDVDPLVQAALAVRADAGARPSLWRRLHADGLWLAVLDADAGADGIEIRLLTILHEGAAFVIGASSEPGLASLLGDRIDAARLIHAPGHHLPRVWPAGHHLVLDPGTSHAVVVTGAEVSGLPGGPMVGHADLADVSAASPDPCDWRHRRIDALVASVDGCASITWRVAPDGGDVLVVEHDEAGDPEAVMARFAHRAPLYGFGGSLAIPARTDLGRRCPRVLNPIRPIAQR